MVLGVLCHLAHGNGLGKGTEGKEKKKRHGEGMGRKDNFSEELLQS